MTSQRQHRLALAVSLSLLLHLLLLGTPGWQVAALDDLLPESTPQIEARLAPLREVAPAPAQPAVAARAPQPRRRVAAVSAAPAAERATPAEVTSPPLSLPPVAAVPPPTPPLLDEPPRPEDALPHPEPGLPRRGSLRFIVSKGDKGFVIGRSLQRWSHDGKTYTLSNLTETSGIAALFRSVRVTQTSEGDIGGEGLQPRQFRTEKNGVAGDAASFDWAGMKLELSAGNPHEVALQPGAQDMLSMFYQFSALFPWVPRESNPVMVATGRKFERYVFGIVGEEALITAPGQFRALHLHAAAGVEAIDIWFGLDLRGLPLKIRYTDRQGDSFDQTAEEIDFEGMPGIATEDRK